MYAKQVPYHHTAFLTLETSSSNKAPGDAAQTVALDLHMMAYKWCSELGFVFMGKEKKTWSLLSVILDVWNADITIQICALKNS